MGKSDIKSSATKPIIVQTEGSRFNARITLIVTESNYNVWSSIIEMHIAEREKLSYFCNKVEQQAKSDETYDKSYSEKPKSHGMVVDVDNS
ncbi:unnamed protein product [Prunus armeniaca]|uniref:Retrotransposon Copia-like N-terminal domain-containing protein n=1 Tax=Prunus armeniaca TaxID=36596 RepID=A0A6J5UUM1_PRUAR|nr:hypothetical protein GBA52_015804 [Prunus armeniaca]CAB4279681.1 unnamed protein product [Prunus armeniaca]CAB4310143.1 unnamed protein product [Prunus armeniaca]